MLLCVAAPAAAPVVEPEVPAAPEAPWPKPPAELVLVEVEPVLEAVATPVGLNTAAEFAPPMLVLVVVAVW